MFKPYRWPPPTYAVFYFGGKTYRGKADNTRKGSRIEIGIKRELIGELPLYPTPIPVHAPVVYFFEVDGETLYEGPARITVRYGRKYPHVQHVWIEPTDEMAGTMFDVEMTTGLWETLAAC